MSTPFLIDDTTRTAIRAADARARKRPIPLAEIARVAKGTPQNVSVMNLADRPPVPWREPEHLLLAFGYRLAISYEEQPDGLCCHLSLSSPKRGRVPRPEALAMILDVLELTGRPGQTWLEEFEPGWHAVNAVALVEPRRSTTQ